MRALFIMMPFSGHLNPSIKLAKYLKNKGYEVVFGGDENVLKFTKQHDCLFTKIMSFPFGINLDSVLHKNSKERWLEGLIDRWTDRLYKARETELVKIVKELRPTHIFIDAFLSSDFVVLYPLLKVQKIKTCFLQTMLPTHQDQTPPLNTVLMPHDKKALEKAWKAYFRKNALKYWTQNILFLGKSDINIVKLKIKKQQISKHYTAFRNKTFHIGFENITELVLAPQAFDFEERSLLPWQHYLGTMIDLDRPENISQTYLDTIHNLKVSYQKLVFCSLGSINMLEKNGQTARLFFERMILVFEQLPQYGLVLAVGTELCRTFPNLPPNIVLFDRVPQLDLLAKTDLFITHGGLNSTLESILKAVPMLMYPIIGDFDPKGNAARVVYHGVGKLGNFETDKKETITAYLHDLLQNPDYKIRLKALQTKLLQAPDFKFLDDITTIE